MNNTPTPKPKLRTGTITWAAVLLLVSAWIGQRTFFPTTSSPEMWLTITAIGLGMLLLGVGVVVSLRDKTDH